YGEGCAGRCPSACRSGRQAGECGLAPEHHRRGVLALFPVALVKGRPPRLAPPLVRLLELSAGTPRAVLTWPCWRWPRLREPIYRVIEAFTELRRIHIRFIKNRLPQIRAGTSIVVLIGEHIDLTVAGNCGSRTQSGQYCKT